MEGAGAFQALDASLDKHGFSHEPLVYPAEVQPVDSKGNWMVTSGLAVIRPELRTGVGDGGSSPTNSIEPLK